MRDSIRDNFEDLRNSVLKQAQKNNFKIAVIAAITAIAVVAVAAAVVYFVKGCGCNDDFAEFEDDFDDDEDFEE